MKHYFLVALYLFFHCTLAQGAEIGVVAPDYPAMSAKQLDLAAFKGKVLLVDFWASWCGPCRKAMPFLNGLRKQHLKDGFEVIGINVDEAAPVDYPITFNSRGECPRIFGMKAMPTSYIIGQTGQNSPDIFEFS